MMKISATTLRYLIVHARRKGRLAFSSRDALSLILIAGLPFVMVSSFSINKSIHHSIAYAYATAHAVPSVSPAEAERLGRHIAAQVKGNPDAFLKLSGPHVAMIFNKPGLQRVEGDVGVWQYRTHDCVLDLYIADKGNGPVVHYETRSRSKASGGDSAIDQTSPRECVKSVFNGHDGLVPMQFASR